MIAVGQWFEHSLTLPFFGIGMKTHFPVLWPLLSFSNLLVYWMQHFHSFFFRIWSSSTGIPSPPLALFQWCFLRLTWLHILGCLALGEWSQHYGYMGYEDIFLYIFLISSASFRFIPFLSFNVPILNEIFPWYL